MEFRILGPLEVVRDGRLIPVGPSRERAVLALLLLAPNQVVSAERLAEDLWHGDGPDQAVRALRVFVSRLRRSLREGGADGIVVTRPPGYVVRVEPGDLDAARFEALVSAARQEARRGAHERAGTTLRAALGLWRGPALADVLDAPLARAEAARLEETRQTALEDRVEADLACGRHRELAAELDALTRAYPLRERLLGQRMIALYRSGRQAEALRAYQDLRSLLADELGLEPTAAVARLVGAILRHEPKLDWSPPGTAGRPSPDVASAAPAAAPTPAMSASEGRPAETLDEGTITIMVTDTEVSGELRARHGGQVARHLLRDHEELVRAQVEVCGGRAVKALGDGFLVVFASTREALACAVGIERALEARRSEMPHLRIRIGLHAGRGLRAEGDDLDGHVHAAARIAAGAAAGQIHATEIVKELAGTTPEWVFHDRGRYRLKGLAERIRVHAVSWREDDDEDGSAAQFAQRTTFVSRESERAELVQLLDGALRGRGALVMIAGEAGVGKTRLTEEVAAEAARRGMRVRVGRCYEMEGTVPYVPFVEILEQGLAGSPSPAAFRRFLGDDAPEVAKLLPRLRRLFPDIPPPLELPPEQERRYLFNSVRDVVSRAASARPQLLVFEDLHWADEPTLLLLEHLAERVSEMPVVALCTYRDAEIAAGGPLARTLDDLMRRNQAHRVGLRRLPADGVAGMLLALGGHHPPASLVRVVHVETDGNPFFVEEVFKHLAEEGRLLDSDGRFLPEVVIDELDVPDSLRHVLGRRLQHLGEDGRRVLAAAAVVGRAFTYELLEALGELEPDALLDALDEAERARLVAPLSSEAAEDRLLFAHELIRQTLLMDLSQPRRRRLHLRVAQTLERLHADALDDHASEIVHHLTRAGPGVDRVRLRHYHSLAGRRAMATAGFEAALRHFEQALILKETAEPNEQPRLFADLAQARRSVGRSEQALQSWDQAREAYELLGDVEGVAQMCFRASQELWWLNRDREALALAQRGLVTLDGRVTPQRVQLLGWTGAAGAWVSPYRFGAGMVDEALGLARQLGDTRLLGHALVNKALHRFAFAQHREGLDAGHEGIALLRDSGDLWEMASVLGFMEVAAVDLGRMGLAAEIGEEVGHLAQRLGHSFVTWVLHEPARWNRDFASNPDLGGFEDFARAHLEHASHMGFSHHSYAFLGHAAFLRGDWDDALRLMEESTRHSPEGHATAGADWGGLLQVLAYGGNPARVVAVYDERREDLPRSGQPHGYGFWYIPLAGVEALYVIGERERAAAIYPLVEQYAAAGIVLTTFQPRLVQRSAGIAAAAGERWELAEHHFQTALRQARDLPHVLEGAETRRFYAQMLLDRGRAADREIARGLLQEAILTYRRIGMPRHEEMTRALHSQAEA